MQSTVQFAHTVNHFIEILERNRVSKFSAVALFLDAVETLQVDWRNTKHFCTY
jgi:hypothetical protein